MGLFAKKVVIDDITYEISKSSAKVVRGSKPEGDATILSEAEGRPVTTIGPEAFLNCNALTGITIPNTVAKIGEFAFAGCEKLPTVAIPDSVTRISNSAFRRCTSLVDISIGTGLTDIDYSTFEECASLENIVIPDNITFIGISAFDRCPNLKTIVIPGSVTDIGNSRETICHDFIFYNNFLHSPDITIICPEGSFAESYAKKWGLRYTFSNPSKNSPTRI